MNLRFVWFALALTGCTDLIKGLAKKADAGDDGAASAATAAAPTDDPPPSGEAEGRRTWGQPSGLRG